MSIPKLEIGNEKKGAFLNKIKPPQHHLTADGNIGLNVKQNFMKVTPLCSPFQGEMNGRDNWQNPVGNASKLFLQ